MLQQLGKYSDQRSDKLVLYPYSPDKCESLKHLLYNPHLRSLLQQIDVSHNANLAMVAAMQEPLFIEFANACLQVVEPMTDAERADMELCSW